MKHYKVILKTQNVVDMSSDLTNDIEVYNHEVEKITDLIEAHPGNYCIALKQALSESDNTLIYSLADALLEYNIFNQEKQIQKIISDNGYEVLIALASHGRTKIIYRFLDTLPYEQQFNKTLILNLITAAAINSHADTVGSLIKTLFPE